MPKMTEFSFPPGTGFAAVTLAFAPAVYCSDESVRASIRSCGGHVDQNNAFRSPQPTLLAVVDLSTPDGGDAVLRTVDDPRWRDRSVGRWAW